MKVITKSTWHIGSAEKPKSIEPGETVDHKELGITSSDVDRYADLGLLAKVEPKAKPADDGVTE